MKLNQKFDQRSTQKLINALDDFVDVHREIVSENILERAESLKLLLELNLKETTNH